MTGPGAWPPSCSPWWPACSGGRRGGASTTLCQTSSTRWARSLFDLRKSYLSKSDSLQFLGPEREPTQQITTPQPLRSFCVVKIPLTAHFYSTLQMWIILEPVIFALIGTEIQIDKIDPSTIGYGTIVLVGALLIRFLCVPRTLNIWRSSFVPNNNFCFIQVSSLFLKVMSHTRLYTPLSSRPCFLKVRAHGKFLHRVSREGLGTSEM